MAFIWLIAIGIVWGVTNALMKRGAVIADKRMKQLIKEKKKQGGLFSWLHGYLQEWVTMICLWQYSLPFLINLSASALFFVTLSDSPITVAVPVTNAVTFGATAAAGAALGEKMHGLQTLLGLSLIIAGVSICILPEDLFYKY